jgi:hypothetical protein
MKTAGKLLACCAVLAALTSAGTLYGFRSEGGADVIHWYAYPGLPFGFAVLQMSGVTESLAVALAVGFLVQLAFCLVVVGLAWWAWVALRR